MHDRLLRALRAQALIPSFTPGCAVLLADGLGSTDRAWKWIRIAIEGLGDLRRGDLQQMVANLQSDPRYKKDRATGLGCTKVIPYDLERASQMDPPLA